MPVLRFNVIAALLLCATSLPASEWVELGEGLRPSDKVVAGGQPTAGVLQQAADAGVKVVVNFRGEGEDPGYDEAAAAAELGLTYLRVPIAGPQGLTPENVLLFDAVLRQVGDQPALMHCATGNRVGALHALHAAKFRDLDAEAAIEFGKAHGLTSLEGAVREQLDSGRTVVTH